MMKQQFALNDGSRPELFVVSQMSVKYEAMSIQISKVLDLDAAQFTGENAVIPYRWVYEEINNDDMVTYARYMGEENIEKNYLEIWQKISGKKEDKQ